MDLIFEVADNVLSPLEIDAILDKAIVLCPAMKRKGVKMYPGNVRRVLPSVCANGNDFFVAQLINALCEWM